MVRVIAISKSLRFGMWHGRLLTAWENDVIKKVDFPFPVVLTYGTVKVKVSQAFGIGINEVEVPKHIKGRLPIHRS